MRGKNTENLIEVLDHKMAKYQQKRYVVMKFIHDEEHIVFSDDGNGRRKMEVYKGVKVVVVVVG